MKGFNGVTLLLLMCGVCWAGNISTPTPLKDSDVAIQLYLEEISDNFNRPETVTVNPDASRRGKKGDMVILMTGTTVHIMINVDGDMKWSTQQ